MPIVPLGEVFSLMVATALLRLIELILCYAKYFAKLLLSTIENAGSLSCFDHNAVLLR
jgi:hypothetical protein